MVAIDRKEFLTPSTKEAVNDAVTTLKKYLAVSKLSIPTITR